MATEVLEQTTGQHLTRRAATVEEFWALPESMLHIEYIDGEIIMAPTPTPPHQRIVGNIFLALADFVRQHGGGEVFVSPLDVILPSGDVVQPDVFFMKSEEAKRAVKDRVRGVPTLAVEVLSPGSIKHDKLTKRDLYEQNGVREYWIVDPKARTIAQLVLRKKHYVLTELGEADAIRSAVLAGFELNVCELLGAV
jgi:Uma2 family endonuclease